jgi:hypothetical protein
VFVDLVHRAGLRGWHLHLASLSSVFLCVVLWIRAKTHDQSERGNAERRALFVGLWPPMLWLMGDSLNVGTARQRGGGCVVHKARRALGVLLAASFSFE